MQGNSDNDDDVKEGGSHPTPLTTVTRELVARLNSAGILYASEALLDMDDVTSDGPPDDDEKGLMPLFVLAIKLKTFVKMSVCCLCAFISVVMTALSLFWHHHGLYALRTADFELITH